MRSGSACAAQQTLSAEAASVLKHSLSLARRRGHAQLTPLHVAATLLSSRASPLRRACLKSQPPHHHHHPLQCRALELCFNVALNRLPATPGPLLASGQPSLSNALVAALKRAQAHQRRGCIEQQQHHQSPPVLAVKVELEQLVLSILDDPSVSRVMREAGFSSAAVKNNLEDSNSSFFQCYNTSGGIYSTPSSPPTETANPSSNLWHSHLLTCASEQSPFLFSPQKKPTADFSSLREDTNVVMEVLLRKKRKNTVIVGDSLSIAEGVVAEIMAKMERGDVPEDLKSAHFIKFHFSSVPLKFMKRDEVEMNISDLRKKVDSFLSSAAGGGGVIVNTGDLKWTVDDQKEDNNENAYSPVDHLIAEMGKLLSWYNNNDGLRVWLMATANYQTYMKCQMKQPPLDVQWGLQAVSVPTGGLGLSLNATSGQESRFNFAKNPSQDLEKRPFLVQDQERDHVLTCCLECKSNYEKEASGFKSIQHKSFSLHPINNDTENSSAELLPFWLKPPVKDDLVTLRRKYNKLCQSLHKGSPNPSSASSVISNQSYLGRDYNYPSSYSCWPNKNTIFGDSETISFANYYPAVKITNQTASTLPRFRRQQSCHIDFSFSNGSFKCQSLEPNLDSLKKMDDNEVKITLALGNLTYHDRASEIALDNDDADLVDLFRDNVPWQSETIPSILESLGLDLKANSRDKFILIKGSDRVGKRRFAVGIAKFVFGSSDLLFCMNMRKSARARETVEEALRDHEKLVVLVENADYADRELVEFLDERHERNSGRAIFILTIDEESGHTDSNEKKVDSVIRMKLIVSHEPNNLDHKRKADWDLPIKSKSQRNSLEIDEKVSSKVLDLNIKADDDHDEVIKARVPSSPRFLDKINNCFVFNMNSDQEMRAKEMFLSKLKRSFNEVSRSSSNILSSFSVDEGVLDEVLEKSGLYLNSLFEQWVGDVFRASLRTVDSREGGKRVVSIRVCLGGREKSCPEEEEEEEDGFMGTCLPKTITVSYLTS